MYEVGSSPKSLIESLELVRLHSPPHILSKLLDICNNPDGSAGELAEIISIDAALTSRLIMAVNSIAFTISEPIDSMQRAVDLLVSITAGEGGKTALSLFFLARLRLDQDDLDGALATIREAQQLYPEDNDFTFLHGEILLRQEQESECRALVSSLLTAEDAESEDYLRAAMLFSNYDKYALAEESLAVGLKRFPDDIALLFQRAATLERMGRTADAEKYFRQLLELEPDNAPALNYLGYMMADGGERLDEAIALVGRALRVDPRNGAYLDSMGWALFRAGMNKQAGSYLLDALKQIPEDPTICEHVGDYFLAIGQRDEAMEHYRKALEFGADDPGALERKLQSGNEKPDSSPGGVGDGSGGGESR